MSRLFLEILTGLFNVYVINIEVDGTTLGCIYSLKNLNNPVTLSFFSMNRVKSGEEVRQLPGVGPSVAAKAVLCIRNHFIPYPDPILQVIPDRQT
jgi:hypothetical protein